MKFRYLFTILLIISFGIFILMNIVTGNLKKVEDEISVLDESNEIAEYKGELGKNEMLEDFTNKCSFLDGKIKYVTLDRNFYEPQCITEKRVYSTLYDITNALSIEKPLERSFRAVRAYWGWSGTYYNDAEVGDWIQVCKENCVDVQVTSKSNGDWIVLSRDDFSLLANPDVGFISVIIK